MFSKPVVFVDIETTGIGWKSSRIIEVAAIRFEDGQVTDEFHSLVNPGSYLPEHISTITGITDNDLVDQPYFEEIADQLMAVCDGAIFIAHNVRFDYAFIKHQLEACGRSFRPELLCTVRLSRFMYPQNRRHSLEQIINDHGIEAYSRHRALDDAKVMLEFCQLSHQKDADKFAQAVQAQLKQRATPPNIPHELIKNLPETCGVYIFEDQSGQPIYIGKSVNIKKRVLSHFYGDNRFDKEMKLSLGVHNISVKPTDNELEALILESNLVKKMLPLHNRQLRRVRQYTALIKRVDANGYLNISIEPLDLAECDDYASVYGLFSTKGQAKQALLDHQKTYSLCSKLLGLEKTRGRCFQSQLGRCRGACVGAETPAQYNLRVEIALERTKLQAWPYEDSVVVSHKDNPAKGLVVDQWRIIGQ